MIGAALVMVVAAVLLPAQPAAADGPWSGYRIKHDGSSAGGWIGGHRVGKSVVYRVTPTKKAIKTKYGRATWVKRAGARASERETARAAYILSKYGRYRYAVQNAAVDAAVHHLLTGGTWGINGRKGRARINRTPFPAEVRSFAVAMLKESAAKAGPYQVTVSASPVPVGVDQTVRVQVRTVRGKRPIAKLPLRISVAGSATKKATTDERGSVSLVVASTVGGPRAVKVQVSRLPSTMVRLKRPRLAGASPVAVAGAKQRAKVSDSVAVQAVPVVKLTAAASVVRAGANSAVSVTVGGGYPSARSAAVRMYGPFSSTSAANCTGTAMGSVTKTITANGAYKVSGYRPTAPGVYVWAVTTAANSYNTSATACGGHVRVQASPKISFPKGMVTAKPDEAVKATFKLAGVPSMYKGTAVVEVFGPFASKENRRCGGSPVVKKKVAWSGPGTYKSDTFRLAKRGFYAIRVTVPGQTWVAETTTPCQSSGAVIRVR